MATSSSSGEPTIFPGLFYDDAPAALEWLTRAFGFVQRMAVPGPNGTIAHAELTLGSGVIMLGSAKPDEGWVSPRSLPAVNQVTSVYVDDPDAHYARAKAAGAQIVREPRDEDYGARGYLTRDLEGHYWYFGNYRPGAYW
jgi:uncharacterized glyoxalase superfamily protein PhnB